MAAKVIEKPVFATLHAQVGENSYSIEHDEYTGRYNLRRNSELLVSGFLGDCQHRFGEIAPGVKMEPKPVEPAKPVEPVKV